jgi:hypothetical protein
LLLRISMEVGKADLHGAQDGGQKMKTMTLVDYVEELTKDNSELFSKLCTECAKDLRALNPIQLMDFLEAAEFQPLAPESKAWIDEIVEKIKGGQLEDSELPRLNKPKTI